MDIQQLLKDILQIEEKYSRNKKPGDDFNIFEICNMEDDELLHSKFLSVLLNPKGRHGKGTLFLEKFLSIIDDKDFPLTNVKIEREFSIGEIDENYDSGGRIDIVIIDRISGKAIVIENKINADDGYKQLLRYSNSYKNAHLVYLTPFGKEPSDISIGDRPNLKYSKISYKKDILNWINECITISDDNLLIKETLIQYKKLLEKMTFQTRSIQMTDDVIKLITSNPDNIKPAFIVADNIHEIKKSFLIKYFKPKLEKISDKFNMTLDFNEEGLGVQYSGWNMYKKGWASLAISFEFLRKDFYDLIFGFTLRKLSKRLDGYLRKIRKIRKISAYKESELWPLYNYLDESRDWDADIFSSFKSKNCDTLTFIEDKIEELLKLVKDRTDL